MIIEKKEQTVESLTKVVYWLNAQAYSSGSPWSLEQIAASLENPHSHYLLLKEKEQWLGYLSYQAILDEAEITQLVILPACQCQGLGHYLMKAFIAQAQKRKLKHVFLEVRASNERARRLYEKVGFEQVSVRKNYYHQPIEDGYVMCLKIEEVSE